MRDGALPAVLTDEFHEITYDLVSDWLYDNEIGCVELHFETTIGGITYIAVRIISVPQRMGNWMAMTDAMRNAKAEYVRDVLRDIYRTGRSQGWF